MREGHRAPLAASVQPLQEPGLRGWAPRRGSHHLNRPGRAAQPASEIVFEIKTSPFAKSTDDAVAAAQAGTRGEMSAAAARTPPRLCVRR